MASLSFLFCGILLVVNVFLNPVGCHAQSKHGDATHKALFVFGDSLFDPGNNQYLKDTTEAVATTWPYGETYFKRPTGRLSDGRIVPDLIGTYNTSILFLVNHLIICNCGFVLMCILHLVAAQFANLPIIPPYLQPGSHQFTDGANFASAGAGVLDATHPGTVYTFVFCG